MTEEAIFIACLAAAAGLLVWGLARALVSTEGEIERRLTPGTSSPRRGRESTLADLSNLFHQVGQSAGRAIQPKTEAEKNALRQRLNYAGIYSRTGMTAFVGSRIVLALAGLAGGAGIGAVFAFDKGPLVALMLGLCGGMAGYLGPTFWLDWRVRRNQTDLDHSLPDALDLLVVCVESGLAMDAAFQRVGREIALAHPALSREFATAHLETQMGVPRNEALRNIYHRSGSESIQSLAGMLIQAERFGTSIAQALRVYSDSLRVKRRYKAEEKAATAAVKITFPLVLFVFPALLIVIGGPAILRIKELNVF